MSYIKGDRLKKREYLAILNSVVDYCLYAFGYSIRPYILEASLNYGEMMMFCESHNKYAILYDWKQFKKTFRYCDYETQRSYAMATAAHEMRHYYQVRQIYSKTPRENEKTIAEWKENHFNGKILGENGCTLLEFFLQPMELDAELYAFYFTAKVLGNVIKLDYIDENYINVLKEKYIELFGENDKDLYLFDIR